MSDVPPGFPPERPEEVPATPEPAGFPDPKPLPEIQEPPDAPDTLK